MLTLYTSQNLAPTYEQLADAFANSKDKVIIAKVDADGAGKPLGQKYGVTGFPSTCFAVLPYGAFQLTLLRVSLALKWFGADGGEPQKYDGGRDLDALANL